MAGSAKFPPSASRNPRFRTMIQIDGELASVDQRTKTGLEGAITAKTGQRVEPRGMCQEYWVIGRLDLSELLLCVRLPKEKHPAKAKGALSYELSSMLVAASHPRAGDVFLDPFAGSGSFVLARLDSPAQKVWYSDLDLREFERGFPRELSTDKRVGFLDDDALALASVPDGCVDVVVTDPPWGEHEDVGMPYEEFSCALVKSFDRVLHRTKGWFVVLTSRRTAPTVEKEFVSGGSSVTSSHEILVNGHPATVFLGGRRPADRSEHQAEEQRDQQRPSASEPERQTGNRPPSARRMKVRVNQRPAR
jgi:16S rRNA G966 N2-methylase RsmD